MKVDAVVSGDEALVGGLIKFSGRDRAHLMRTLGEQQIARIKARVFAGQLLSGAPMKPSVRAERDGGQTLMDRGHMLGGMQVVSAVPDHAVVAFPDLIQGKKALWNQEGTGVFAGRGRITPHGKSPLSWRLRGGEWVNRWSVAGTPPRPFFGFGPGDGPALAAAADRETQRIIDEALRS